jgi:CHAT domain
MPSLPPVSAFLNPALDAVRGRGGTASTREINVHVAAALRLPPELALAVPGGDRFRAAMREVRETLRTAGLLEEHRPGEWALVPGVAGPIAAPDALVDLVQMWSESGAFDVSGLIDWRVDAAETGTFDPTLRVAAAFLRGRDAVPNDALRAIWESLATRLRGAGVDLSPLEELRATTRDVSAAAHTVAPAAGELLRQAELLLWLLGVQALPPQPPQPEGQRDFGLSGMQAASKKRPTIVFRPPRPGGSRLDFNRYYREPGDLDSGTSHVRTDAVLPDGGNEDGPTDYEVLEDDDAAGFDSIRPYRGIDVFSIDDAQPDSPEEIEKEEAGFAPETSPVVTPPQAGPDAFVATPAEAPPQPRPAPVANEEPPATEPQPAPKPASRTGSREEDARPPRFPDFHLLREDGRRHDAHRPLTVGETYVLEVHVTPRATGLPTAAGKAREAIVEPASAHPVTLTVTVEASSHVMLSTELASLVLPPDGPTPEPARFEFLVKEAKPAKLRVRIYYRLNLLARARVVAEAADEVDGDDPRAEPVVVVEPEVLDPSFGELSDVAPRDAHIDVTLEDGAFALTLAFRRDQPGEAEFRARLKVKPAALEDALVRVREVLAGISAEPVLNQKLEGTKYLRARHLRTLAAEGRRLWGMLFDQDIDSAASELARMLTETPLPPDSRLQISLERGAEEFVFPWALLFSGELPEEPQAPPADAFWGTRYELEVRTDATRVRGEAPLPTGAGVKLAFALHPFANAAEQEKLLRRLEADSGGRLRAGKPLQVMSEWVALLRDCDAQVLYFYTHGYTRQRKADIAGTGSGAAPAKDADRDKDRTYIELPEGGRLYLDELMARVSERMRSEPLVFLNMCESAQMTPSLSEGLVDFFLDRGARAVIGTECPMTIYFAHPFAERVLSQLLRGDTVGKAMLDARRHFVERANNVLGFAYSLYGTAALSFAPPVLPAPAGD